MAMNRPMPAAASAGAPRSRLAAAAALATVLAIPAEGLRQVAYRDPPGILTVCYGHTGSDVRSGVVYPMSECRQLLTQDMRRAVEMVERCVPGLPEHQLAAWSDTVFNVGPAIVCDPSASTAARLLRAGERQAACAQLTRWDKARVGGVMVTLPGLTKRRAAARKLCEGGVNG